MAKLMSFTEYTFYVVEATLQLGLVSLEQMYVGINCHVTLRKRDEINKTSGKQIEIVLASVIVRKIKH